MANLYAIEPVFSKNNAANLNRNEGVEKFQFF